MELRQLRTFEAVVRHRTVTDAANALEMAPSSVSEQIRALERSLGVALFERTARGMRLTEAGDRLLGWARRLLDQADQARREVTDAAPRLRLGALETIAATHVPRVLARLAERRPDLRAEVRATVSRDEMLADVIAGRLDAGLLLDTGEALGDLGFPAAPLDFLDVEAVPLALVAAPGHRLLGRSQVDAEDLDGERLLVNVPNCSFRMAADRVIGSGTERVQAGGVQVMRAWAEQGLGVALLPEFAVAGALEVGTLGRVGFAAPALSLRLVWRGDQEERAGLRDLLYAASV
ncbi:LysR family transcriptional regulator [Actinomadura hibisca]|uniref:LysR family transcriptional regulator n=1 Tax=Actinomadura hibisca TaxID=68565 RepID=UPI000832EFA5|nr:LysR family transcriptional regulator [Actinomadura hibisca]